MSDYNKESAMEKGKGLPGKEGQVDPLKTVAPLADDRPMSVSGPYAKLLDRCLRLMAWWKKDNRYNLYRDLYREQFLPPKDIEQLQTGRLRKLLEHASLNSPYYREKYSGLADLINDPFTLSDLARWPVLKREELQDHYQEILCSDPGPHYADASGGSTGHPVNFWHDDSYKTFSDACELLFLSWMNVSPGDRRAAFWGADRDFKELSFKARLMQIIKRTKRLNSFNVTEQDLNDFLRTIHTFQPTYIIGYASSLYLAARHINASSEYRIRPRAVRSAAEMLYGFQKQEIEKAFGVPVFNFYGSREVSHLAAECSVHGGMHVFASGRIIEVVDEHDKALPSGETGYLAITDLTNFGFPFIRYLNGDMGALSPERCSCGRGYPLLKAVTGRASDIIFLNGKNIHGEFFTHLFYGQPEVKQFQVIQEAADRITVKIVTRTSDFDSQAILQKIKFMVGENINIDIKRVDSIAPTKSGKYRFTINNMA